MSKELEALERGILEFEKDLEDDCNNEWLKRVVAGMKKCYQRLEAIDNAKPSEALKNLEYLRDYLLMSRENITNTPYYNPIKQALIKAQEQEKVIDVIKEKDVKIHLIKRYNNVNDYNECMPFSNLYLTQEEFDLLKKALYDKKETR